jgi:hypothetical protein
MPTTIPLLKTNERPGRPRERAPQGGDTPEKFISLPAVPLRGYVPEAPSLEELQLVQRIFFLSGVEKARVIVFCGVEAGDCAESMCARTGEVLSYLVNERVCVMDANLRAPTLHLRYEIDETGLPFGGTEQHFSEDESSLDSKLWVLPAAALRDCRPGFAPDAVRRQLSVLRERFGFLLIAAPPLSTAAEGLLLGQMADGVVLNVMARSTQRAMAMKVRRSLELYNVRVLGAVLNNPPPRRRRTRGRKGDSQNA